MAKRSAMRHKTPSLTSDPPFAVADWPATEPKLMPLREIVPYERNPRTHPQQQIELLAKLMELHGVDQPIVVDEANVVLKGHGRLAAAHLLVERGVERFSAFPVVMHKGLTAKEKTALRIEDNQVALLSGWDRELLHAEMTTLKLAGYDTKLLGFSDQFLDSLKLSGLLTDLIETSDGESISSAVAAGHRGVTVRFDLMPGDRDAVISWLARERDKRNLRTTAEALVAIARENG